MQRGTVLTGDTSKQVRDQKEFEATQVGCDKQQIYLQYFPVHKTERSGLRVLYLSHLKHRVFSLTIQMNIFLVNMKNQTMQAER